MNDNNDVMKAMISNYIEGKLSKLDTENFERYMKNNTEFSSLVNSINNNKCILNEQPYLAPSKYFLVNLDSKIKNLETNDKKYWFGINYEYSLSFSFIIIFMSLLFINQYYNIESNDTTITSIQIIENEKSAINDSTNIIEDDGYQILQVKTTEKK